MVKLRPIRRVMRLKMNDTESPMCAIELGAFVAQLRAHG
jgi:hypothetical protein